MASGKSHTLATVAISGFLLGVGVWFKWSGVTVVSVGGGSLAGVLLTPDHDLIDTSGNYSMHMLRLLSGKKGCSRFLANLWRLFWWPYGKMISHRSFWSHTPGFGTLLRLVYLLWIPYTISALVGYHWVYQSWMLSAFLGLCVADTLHWIMDKV